MKRSVHSLAALNPRHVALSCWVTCSHPSIHLLALTPNFISLIGCESCAHSDDLWSIRLQVEDRSLDDVDDVLCRLSFHSLQLDRR